MKLVIAIINLEDVAAVSDALNSRGYSSTLLASKGSFLVEDNMTFLVGVDETLVSDVKQTIIRSVHRREKELPNHGSSHYGYEVDENAQVVVGGVTMFVVDVEQFERI
jgi:uncharacterized protein YaaQ